MQDSVFNQSCSNWAGCMPHAARDTPPNQLTRHHSCTLQGKSPECLSQAPDGGPKPQKYAQITTVVQNKKMRSREEARAAQLEAARKETAALSTEEVMERLKEVRSREGCLKAAVPACCVTTQHHA